MPLRLLIVIGVPPWAGPPVGETLAVPAPAAMSTPAALKTPVTLSYGATMKTPGAVINAFWAL